MLDTLIKIITCISPILCAIIAWNSTTTTKKTKEYMELQSKYNKELEEKKARESKEQRDAMARMQQDIANVSKKVDELAQAFSMEDLHDKLEHLTAMSQLNFEYSQSLSSVICSIGDCIERADMAKSDDISKEMAEHRKRESEFAKRLTKIVI